MKQQAKDFAEKAHQGQHRKNSDAPYITHPFRVAKQLEQASFSEELICAGYLHDVVEDTPYEIEDITAIFGERVSELVATHTEDKSKSWRERKQHTIDTVKLAEKEVKYLIVADKLDNLLALEKDLEDQGSKIWENFNAGYTDQKWYNTSIAVNMADGLSEEETPDYFQEFAETVQRIFT